MYLGWVGDAVDGGKAMRTALLLLGKAFNVLEAVEAKGKTIMNSSRPSPSSSPTYPAVFACARALLAGRVLLGGGLSAGMGTLLDWRGAPYSGRVLHVPQAEPGPHESAPAAPRRGEPDAFDLARAFVAEVGVEVALAAARDEEDPRVLDFCAALQKRGRTSRGIGDAP